ncbi:hypothetical protein [Clostridium sp. FP1]|uniref:hypothetical protein n=1 Tax=Clostridium sp. FP1 TaxID=2724076 RepID=UPI0013E93148|nr:hypothetical protein [Clostridium sp. FP1]MBZ9633147.1 hypothetical protein [Clostridium sp. FP1]
MKVNKKEIDPKVQISDQSIKELVMFHIGNIEDFETILKLTENQIQKLQSTLESLKTFEFEMVKSVTYPLSMGKEEL